MLDTLKRQFKFGMLIILISVLMVYGGYKYRMITVAFDLWQGQQIDDPTGLAAN